MLQIDFAFFNVEIIIWFTLNFVAICSDNSYPFGFLPRRKLSPIEILKFIVTTLRHQDKKVTFIQVYEDGALARSSEFMNTCHNINIKIQTTCVYASSINRKIEIPNNTLAKITISLLMNSSKKQYWCFSYKYFIGLFLQTKNILRVDVIYFLWYGKRPSYKHIRIWGVWVYIINGCGTIKKIDDISNWVYFIGYVSTILVILYCKPDL